MGAHNYFYSEKSFHNKRIKDKKQQSSKKKFRRSSGDD